MPQISTFPHEDRAFAGFVRWTLDSLAVADRLDPLTVERRLRRWHNRAVVRSREAMAGFGDETWYVYRDGHPGVRLEDEWWRAPDAARVAFDASGHFIEANRAACELVGLAGGCLLGRHWTELVAAEARADGAPWVWEQLESDGWVQSVFDLPLADGGCRTIEYHSERTADPDRSVSTWRIVAEAPAGVPG